MTPFSQLEFRALELISTTFRSDFLDLLMPSVSFLGDIGWIWILFSFLFMFRKTTRKTGLTMAVALLFSYVVANLVLKPLVARPRPYEVNAAIQLLIRPPHDFSFPSGHTQASFAAAAAIYHNWKWPGLAALVLAGLIAFSRLYLMVHYVTDVLAGAAIGYCLGGLADAMINGLQYRYKNSTRKRRKRRQ